MQPRVATLVCGLVFAASHARAEVILGYTEARHARFVGGTVSTSPTVNPTFYLSAFDFSGVGWLQEAGFGRHLAMITPRHFIAAAHVSQYGPGAIVNFRPQGTTSGATLMMTVASVQQIGGSDVLLGTLTADVPSTVAKYPIVVGPRPQYVNAELYSIGQRSRVGRNRISGFQDAVNVGTGPTNTFFYDYDPSGFNLDSTGVISPDEFIVEGNDSGSPTFLPINGGLGLLGHHVALATDQGSGTPIASADSFLNDYTPLLAANVLANGGFILGTVAVPEPSSLALIGVAAAGFWWRRSSRRQPA